MSRSRVGSGLAAIGVVAVLAVGPGAAVTASRLPQASTATATGLEVPEGALRATTLIREVPVGLARGTRIRSVADVAPYVAEATGPEAEDGLLALLAPPEDGESWPYLEPDTFAYPFRFADVDAVLDPAPPDRLEEHGAALGAALLLLAADPDAPEDLVDHAARVAFSVLDRARAAGGCDAQLNLLALVASDDMLGRDVVREETAKAEAACPQDPTPGWLAAQGWIQDLGEPPGTADLQDFELVPVDAARRAATELSAAFPDDPGVLATLGDMYLAIGRYLARAQPFTARRAFQDADTVFGRLRTDGDSADVRIGAARAQLGLGHADVAARLATTALDGTAAPARALALAVSAEERARQFGRASELAKRFADLGASAFPAPAAVIPRGPPLSFGSDRFTPLAVLLVIGGQGGGGVAVDDGFIPAYREVGDLTDPAEGCPQWGWRRDAFLAGDPRTAGQDWPEEFLPTEPTRSLGDCPDGAALRLQIDTWLAGGVPDDPQTDQEVEDAEVLLDDRQHLLRWAGDLTAARREARRWAGFLGDRTALAHQRLGEIAYLARDHHAAAAHFAEAALRWRVLSSSNDLAVLQAHLGQGAALLRAGRSEEAVAVLRPVVLDGAKGYGYQTSLEDEDGTARDFATVSYYAATLLADHELATGQDRAAAGDLGTALGWAETLGGDVRLDVARNSAAIAFVNTGDTGRAVSLSQAAVATDPLNPVYLMTAAEVAHRAGDVAGAIRKGRAALDADPSNYPAANNLGVLLARQGRFTQASGVLRAAVAADPAYALGWHNLGVVEGRRGPLQVLTSQGALAEAVSLDPGFADRPHRVLMDTTTYRTELDLSKALPQGWSFAGSQTRAPVVTVGLLAAALAGLGLVSLRGTSASPAAKEWLDGVGARVGRVPGLARVQRPVWAVAATVGAFLLAFWREQPWPWTGIAYALAVVALVGAGILARSVVARRHGGGVVHGTWAPGVLVGLVSGALGAPIAPLPVVRTPAQDSRVAMAAPLTLAAVALALLLEAAWLHTPLTTSLAVAAFIMAGSLLLPVDPLDGARAGRAGIVGAVGLLGAVLLLGLGLA